MDIVLLSKCSELWVFGERISKGMSIEIEKEEPGSVQSVGVEEGKLSLDPFFHITVSSGVGLLQEGYIPPEEYNVDFRYCPEDFTDVGQAEVLSRVA